MNSTISAARPLLARRAPPEARDATRLLIVDPSLDRVDEIGAGSLPDALEAGDVLVVNDASTVPGSLLGLTDAGEPVEVRLTSRAGDRSFWGVLFGHGDWRTKTEDRAAPPTLRRGEHVRLGEGRRATIQGVSEVSPRLVQIEVDDATVYAVGRPIQYSYLSRDLELDEVQTAYASRPWAFEMPSAGRPLTMSSILELERRGVRVRSLTHAAGLSSTGDPTLDAMLPFPERYDIPAETVEAIDFATGRVIAVGTTVVRALEGCHRDHGRLVPGEGVTDLVIGPELRPKVAQGLLSGIHEPGESHYRLLLAFASDALLRRAVAHAREGNMMNHEFGDGMLISCSSPSRR